MHDSALTLFADAVTAYAAGDPTRAAHAARAAAAADPASLVAAEAAIYLGRLASAGPEGVYVTGEAFGAFIRGGGNLPLYAAVSAALRAVYERYTAFALLDVGVGDGMALLPALGPSVSRVDLVEPSAAMLARTAEALTEREVAFRPFPMGILAFAEQSDARWEVAQATFSLQSLAPADRRSALAWLRDHAGRLLLVEFDPPELGEGLDPRRLAHFVARYEQGLAEYRDDGGLVAQGFLMPVFFGYFDPSAARTNYEQPIAGWEADLQGAGFTHIRRQHLFDYWWAPAFLLDAA